MSNLSKLWWQKQWELSEKTFTGSINGIHSSLKHMSTFCCFLRNGCFEQFITLDVPSQEQRASILEGFLRKLQVDAMKAVGRERGMCECQFTCWSALLHCTTASFFILKLSAYWIAPPQVSLYRSHNHFFKFQFLFCVIFFKSTHWDLYLYWRNSLWTFWIKRIEKLFASKHFLI